MDTAYLKTSIGDCLVNCMSEVSEKRPRDPIEYIAQWLYKFTENQNYMAEKKKEAEDLIQQKVEFEKDQILQEKRKEEILKIAEKEAERKRLEEERAKKENTSPTKLPVVMEAQEPAEAEKKANSEQKKEEGGEKLSEEKEEEGEETKEPAEVTQEAPEEPKQEEATEETPAEEEAS